MSKAKRKAPAKRQAVGASAPDVGKLQELIVKSIVTGEPLPGGTAPVTFPDVSFLQRQATVVIDIANFAGKVESVGGKSVRIASLQRIRADARAQGDVTYLHFEPAVVEGDEIGVTVQGKIASGDPQRGTGNLSHIQMRFRKRGRAWELVEPPSYLAS